MRSKPKSSNNSLLENNTTIKVFLAGIWFQVACRSFDTLSGSTLNLYIQNCRLLSLYHSLPLPPSSPFLPPYLPIPIMILHQNLTLSTLPNQIAGTEEYISAGNSFHTSTSSHDATPASSTPANGASGSSSSQATAVASRAGGGGSSAHMVGVAASSAVL